MSYIIGLTGGIGSGKTTISNLFAQLGAPVVDADEIARQIVAKGSYALNQIITHFGTYILNSQDELDRAKLRSIIFHSDEERTWLNNLLHPLIRSEMFNQLNNAQTPYVIWVVPLLIENKLTEFCDRILVIDISIENQIQRIKNRDGNSEELIQRILNAQIDRKTRLSYADDIIDNNIVSENHLEQLKQLVTQLHHKYLELAKQKTLT